MNVLRQNGIRIPEDIAVIGFDNDPVCTELIPSLSSLSLNQELIAQKLFDLVLAKNNRAEVIPLYPELILRESC
jgi:DNA-binding LacI/PurR family transcriptional regulator